MVAHAFADTTDIVIRINIKVQQQVYRGLFKPVVHSGGRLSTGLYPSHLLAYLIKLIHLLRINNNNLFNCYCF